MGSVKKKFAKTLQKITPKEIAPVLPFLAMAIPGMQGLSPLLKFALPQLLTAAGSARQTGKINLLNQAMAGIGSLASMNAANAAAANTTAATAAGEGAKTAALANNATTAAANVAAEGATYLDALGNVAGGTTANMTAAQLAAAQKTAETAALANNATSAANTMAAQTGIGNQIANSALFNNSFAQPFGTAINNPGFNLPYAMAVGGSGASMATADYAGKKELEFEEDKARDIAKIDNYRDAQGNLTDYFTDRDYTLEDLYGVGNVPDFLRSNFLAANGGRAQLAGGGMSPGERNAREGHQNENSGGSNNSGGNGGGYQTGNNASANTSSNTNTNTNAGGNSNSPGGNNTFVGPGLPDPNINFNPSTYNNILNALDLNPGFNPSLDDDDDDGLGFNQFDVGNGILTVDGNPLKKELELNYSIPFANGGRAQLAGGGNASPGGDSPDVPPSERNKMRGNYDPATMKPENQVQAAAYDAYINSLPSNLQPPSSMGGNFPLVPRPSNMPFTAGYDPSTMKPENQVQAAAYDTYMNSLPSNLQLPSNMGGNFPLVPRPRPTADLSGADNYNNIAANNNNDVSDAFKKMLSYNQYAYGGRIGLANGGMEGIMGAMQAPGVPAGMELDYRSSGGFIPMGGPERADDVPAMLSKNEFVMTADAVRGLGNGDIESGAQQMYDLMNNLEAQG